MAVDVVASFSRISIQLFLFLFDRDENWYNDERPTFLAFNTIARVCPDVTSFSVAPQRDADFVFPDYLHGLFQLDDNEENDVAGVISGLSRQRLCGQRIRDLSLNSIWSLEDKHVNQLLDHLPVLEHLTIRNSPSVSGLFLKSMPTGIRLKSLRLFYIAKDDRGMRSIWRGQRPISYTVFARLSLSGRVTIRRFLVDAVSFSVK